VAEINKFGTTAGGQQVRRVVLESDDLTVGLLTHGARLQFLSHRGSPDLACGSDTLADFEGDLVYNGPVIAPVLNRINHAKATLGGEDLTFEANQDGRITLHGGAAGTQNHVWEISETGEASVTFKTDLAHGDGGFPGNRTVTATYAVDGPMLSLDLEATTDRLTFMSPGFHPYWNLDGAETWEGHTLQVTADRYLPSTEDFLPTGDIVPVKGTRFDFNATGPIGALLDNNFCVNGNSEGVQTVAHLIGAGGRTLEIRTDAPGLQVYSGYQKGIAVEPQLWPDSPNNPTFPSIELRSGETLRQRSEWIFR